MKAEYFRQQRQLMVHQQLVKGGVKDKRVLAAFSSVPRELFVKPGSEEHAYEDSPLCIEEGQTISQPRMVAMMCELAELTPQSRVLEVGTGRGYAAAILGQLAAEVYSIERLPVLASLAAKKLASLGYSHIQVDCRDGTMGWPEKAPFDAILVAAASPSIPPTLKSQLKVGGRLIIPVGGESIQSLVKVTRLDEDLYETREITTVRFVPLIGREGW